MDKDNAEEPSAEFQTHVGDNFKPSVVKIGINLCAGVAFESELESMRNAAVVAEDECSPI